MIKVENDFETNLIRVNITDDEDGRELALDLDLIRALHLAQRLIEKAHVMMELDDESY